jgi:hypothetical protein
MINNLTWRVSAVLLIVLSRSDVVSISGFFVRILFHFAPLIFT